MRPFLAIIIVFVLIGSLGCSVGGDGMEQPAAAPGNAGAGGADSFPAAAEDQGPAPDFSGMSFISLEVQPDENPIFVIDGRGYMQMSEDGFDRGHAADLVAGIDSILKARGIPLVYVATLPRFDTKDFSKAKKKDFFGQRHDDLIESLSRAGVDVLDAKKELADAGERYLYPFKTDLHLETAGEFRTAMLLADKLESIGIEIPDKDIVFDPKSYLIESYELNGNLATWDDIAIIGNDEFEFWIPVFDTDLTLENPAIDSVRSGTFRETIMNGMEYKESHAREYGPYWVRNYLQYPCTYYTIDNHMNEDGPRLLFLIDSIALRTTAYFSLGAGHITIVDPREGGIDHLNEEIFYGEYDAVIIAAASRSFYQGVALVNEG